MSVKGRPHPSPTPHPLSTLPLQKDTEGPLQAGIGWLVTTASPLALQDPEGETEGPRGRGDRHTPVSLPLASIPKETGKDTEAVLTSVTTG